MATSSPPRVPHALECQDRLDLILRGMILLQIMVDKQESKKTVVSMTDQLDLGQKTVLTSRAKPAKCIEGKN